jgi:uncharacterized protein YbjQ (UPF0145 family)
MDGIVLLFQIGGALLLIFVGLLSGSWIERRHYRSIELREADLRNVPVNTLRELPGVGDVAGSRLVVGSVVISIDAFKQALASLQRFFGGEVTAYETLVDRARREAMLRLYDEIRPGEVVANVRLETSPIGVGGDRITSIEVLAFATAVELRP